MDISGTIQVGLTIDSISSKMCSRYTTYHVLGEDIEVKGYNDSNIAIAISILNILGKPFYDELKKNISLPKEVEEYLELKFKVLERDKKIKDIIR